MRKILTLNNISVSGLNRFPRELYEVASEIQSPDAIVLRSFNMHQYDIAPSLLCVGRAGAGVNNIPVTELTQRGIPVFNSPGANANAVKELVVAGMLLAARNICPAWRYTQNLDTNADSINSLVEQGKKEFAGFELQGKTLGVVGLGAIGRLVANAALALGMRVIGFDPGITVSGAWALSSDVQKARSIDELLSEVDFVSFHVPLIDATRHLVNAERIKLMKPSAIVLNFARGGIVDDESVIQALDTGKLGAYVCDFPTMENKSHPKVIALPHLGASTSEAEDNCAAMVVDQIRDHLEHGNIVNSVNFPEVVMARAGVSRLAIANENVPNMVGQITTKLAAENINIVDLLNRSKEQIAYTLVDVDSELSQKLCAEIAEIKGVLRVRVV